MNGTSLALALALSIGLIHFNFSSNPIVFTLLSIVSLVHLTNHMHVEKKK